MRKIIESIRREYTAGGIDPASLPDHPVLLLEKWMEEAISHEITDPNAMIISTVSKGSRPSSRTVLLKDIDRSGLIFYTHYNSRKGKELSENPFLSAVFLWAELERQVRIEGKVEKLDSKTSDSYFATRPRESQIAAWASPQSEPVSGREELEQKFLEFEEKFRNKTVPRPDDWGGYRIIPDYFEFWQGRSGRLNDRLIFRLEKEKWTQHWLAP
jgi:pyridoxamine 5'-phosphate oxidase